MQAADQTAQHTLLSGNPGAKRRRLDTMALPVQVYEYRFNVIFDDAYASVSYTNYNFQVFSQADSCTVCSLNDTFVGVNRCLSYVLHLLDHVDY